MSATAKIHESHYDHKMDPKYRVSVPVAFRPDVEGAPIRLQYSSEHEMPVIKVFSREVFETKFDLIEKSDLTPKQKSALIGSLRMLSKEVTINPQGKLTIPKEWAEKVGIKAEGPVKLAGRGPYYMICTEETFDRIADIEATMDDGGLGVL